MKSCGVFFGILLLCASLRTGAEQYDWVKRFDGDNSSGSAIGLDSDGNVYVAGNFNGALTIGTNHFVSTGSSDIFIAKLNPDGQPIWAMTGGGPGNDGVNRLAVSSNGVVFVCGAFSTNAVLGTNDLSAGTNNWSGSFVARIDEASVSWIDPFTPGIGAAGITLSRKDQSIWIFGKNGFQMFVKGYRQDGAALGSFVVGEPSYGYPHDIAVASNGNMFVTGSFGIWGDGINFGTTNIRANFGAQFTASLDTTGRVLWAWSADTGWASYGYAIALAKDGSVISAGDVQRTAFGGSHYWYAFVAKHSAHGEFMWLRALGEHRGSYGGRSVAVDANGYVLLAGYAHGYYWNPRSRMGALLAVFDPDGNKLFDHHINSTSPSDDNRGWGIACNPAGDAWFTGYLKGVPKFGTNVMGDGPSGVANAFIARRPTFLPALRIQGSGTNIVLNWPRTGVPFALQQSDILSSNTWSNVPNLPEETGHRRQVTLPASDVSHLFRLTMTNEVPIRHLPEIDNFGVNPWPSFLSRSLVFVITSNSISSPLFYTIVKDADEDSLSFQWYDNGQLLTNGMRVTVFYTYHEGYPRYEVIMSSGAFSLTHGTHTISLVAFDGAFYVTNSWTLEVLSVSAAIEELITAVDAANTIDRDWLIAPLESAYDAVETGQLVLAAGELQEFQTRVQASVDLSASQKTLFNDSAQTILNALPSGVTRTARSDGLRQFSAELPSTPCPAFLMEGVLPSLWSFTASAPRTRSSCCGATFVSTIG